MRKNFLFAALTVLLAGFWFGGASLAECTTNVACNSNSGSGYNSLREAIAEAQDGDTIELGADDNVTFGGDNLIVTINQNLTIDGKGKTLYGSGTFDAHGIEAAFTHGIGISTGNVTIKNLTLSGFAPNGSIDDHTYPIHTLAGYDDTLNIENVNFFDINNRAFIFYGSGNITIKGGTINLDPEREDPGYKVAPADWHDRDESVFSGEHLQSGIYHTNGTLTIEDLTIKNIGSNRWAIGGISNSAGHVIIKSGTFEVGGKDTYSSGYVLRSTGGEFTIEGGDFSGNILDKGGSINISGGKFSVQPNASYIVTGKAAVDKGNGWFEIDYDCEDAVARVNDEYCYGSLKAAVDAADTGATITLLKNDNVSFGASNLEIRITKNLTINGDGKTLYGYSDVDTDSHPYHFLYIGGSDAENVTIENLVISGFANNSNRISQEIFPVVVGSSFGGKIILSGLTINDFHRQGINIGNGEFEINNVKINGTHYDSHPFQQGIEILNSAHGTIDGVIIKGVENKPEESAGSGWDAYGIVNFGNGDITIKNTTIANSDGGVFLGAAGNITLLEGNNFNATSGVLLLSGDATGKYIINGGNYVGELKKLGEGGNFEISAGKFSADPSAYVVAGKVAKSISNGGDYNYEVADPDPAPSYSGGGGSGGSKSSTKTDTKATTGDNKTVDNNKTDETKADETKTNENNGNNDGKAPATDSKYSQEMIDAYNWAFKNGITTMPSIDEADMEGGLTRIAMAKMLSQYAINILGKTPDTSKVVPAFPDVTAQMDADYSNGVTLAYQLGIMGIGIETFRPNDLVTRAEFATALSRLLFNTPDGEDNYYTTHLQKLMDEKIITVDTPDLQELRGYVMIMLMRSANS